VPTLVVHGELDPGFPAAQREALREAIPDATLLVLDRAGHELPGPLWPVITDTFLARTGQDFR
jgi:pimeloyl-ACP methyl ester carboxylesterase